MAFPVCTETWHRIRKTRLQSLLEKRMVSRVLPDRKRIEIDKTVNGTVLRTVKIGMIQSSPAGLDDWLTDPVFWLGIVVPAMILVVVSLYFCWMDHKAKLVESERRLASKPSQNKK